MRWFSCISFGSTLFVNVSVSTIKQRVKIVIRGSYMSAHVLLKQVEKKLGAQWLSGRVLDLRPKGPRVRASPASLRCGP